MTSKGGEKVSERVSERASERAGERVGIYAKDKIAHVFYPYKLPHKRFVYSSPLCFLPIDNIEYKSYETVISIRIKFSFSYPN